MRDKFPNPVHDPKYTNQSPPDIGMCLIQIYKVYMKWLIILSQFFKVFGHRKISKTLLRLEEIRNWWVAIRNKRTKASLESLSFL